MKKYIAVIISIVLAVSLFGCGAEGDTVQSSTTAEMPADEPSKKNSAEPSEENSAEPSEENSAELSEEISAEPSESDNTGTDGEGDKYSTEGLEDEAFEAEADGKKNENNDASFTRAAEDMEETEYTADDVAGYWKYENLDNIYVAIYDTGIYEIYDMKSGDVKSDGTYTVDGEGIVMTETGKDDGEYLQIESMVRLLDDQGDALVPYAPEGSIGASDDSGNGAVSRATGSLDNIEGIETKDVGKGNYRTGSKAKACYIEYPYNYYCGAGDTFFYTTDGQGAYVTVRNVTIAYNNYNGSLKQFLDASSEGFLIEDFKYFYGKKTGYSDVRREYKKSDKCLSDEYVNLWNNSYDISCEAMIYLIKYDDGTEQLVQVNYFWNFQNKASFERVKHIKGGAKR